MDRISYLVGFITARTLIESVWRSICDGTPITGWPGLLGPYVPIKTWLERTLWPGMKYDGDLELYLGGLVGC